MNLIQQARQSIHKFQQALDDNCQRQPLQRSIMPTHPVSQLQQPLFSADQQEQSFLTQMLLTVLNVLYAAFPTMISFELNMIGTLINIYLIGQFFHAQQLASIGLGAIIGNMLCYFVIQSINMGMGAQSIRAFSKNNNKVLGLIYQRGLAINFIICILLTPVIYMSDKILLFFGYSQEIVIHATIYVWGLLPSFYLFCFQDTTKNYLQAQSVIFIPVIIQGLVSVIHFWIGSALIPKYIFIGAAWTKNICDALNCLFLYMYIIFIQPTKQSWIQWTEDALHNLYDYLQIVLSTGITSYLQTLAFQILCIIAAQLKQSVEMATQIAVASTLLTLFLVQIGLSQSLIHVLSKSISQNKLASARRKVFLGAFISITISFIIVIELINYQQEWLHFFTHDNKVIIELKKLKYILYVIIILQFIQMALSSVLKALDMHNYILIIYINCFYILGIGSGIFLCFIIELEIKGLWIGWAIGLFFAIIWLIKIICKIDWEQRYRYIRQLK